MLIEHVLILAICGLGVFHGISLGAYLLIAYQPNSLSIRLFGFLMLLFGLRIGKSILLYFTSDLDFLFITLGLTLILSFGPLFYFYVRSFLQESFKLKKQDAWHAIPFAIFLILNIFGLLNKDFYLYFGVYFIYLHFLAYIIVSFLWQRKNWPPLTTKKATTKRKWINYIHLGIVFIWFSYFMFLLGEAVPYILGPITYSLVVYPLSFWAIIHKVLEPEKEKYKNSRLNNQRSQKLISDLDRYMQKEQPFLNPDLKLPELATHLKVTPHELSQAVNENYRQNIQQYLNTYRVKGAQAMLSSSTNDHLTISAIAFESGFNSLSAFNTAFKKTLKTTPSQYRKQQNQQFKS